MLDNNFRKKKPQDNRQRYLKYNDVFMSGGISKPRNAQTGADQSSWNSRPNSQNQQQMFSNNYKNQARSEQEYNEEYDYDDNVSDAYQDDSREQEYFSNRNNIIDEKMVRYQKRQLPPLQRYSPNSHRDGYAEFNQSYWDEENTQRKRQNFNMLGSIWQKFIITFASILSLVCLSWIAYNWNSDKQSVSQVTSGGVPIIEPEQSSFKVLPENPGGAEVSYRDKTVYNRVDNGMSSIDTNEKLLPPQEETFSIPNQEHQQYSQPQNNVEEYSIVDDKVYYIKISAGKDKQVLQNELKLLKKKFAALFSGKTCEVKKVSNSNGDQKQAILVGPFDSQDGAIDTARDIGGQCYVISVKG